MTKTEIKAAMLKVLSECDDSDKDEWYTTERSFAQDGIIKLAEELRIVLTCNELNGDN